MATYTSYRDYKTRRRNCYINGGKLGQKKPPAYCWCERHRGYLSDSLIKEHRCEKRNCPFYENLEKKRAAEEAKRLEITSEKQKIKMKVVKMNTPEYKYTKTLSKEDDAECGCIGHMIADFGGTNTQFQFEWTDHDASFYNDEFKSELQNLIGALRTGSHQYDFLRSREAMRRFCYGNDRSLPLANAEFGVRVNTGRYTYLMVMSPNKYEDNFVCYCYVRQRINGRLARETQAD